MLLIIVLLLSGRKLTEAQYTGCDKVMRVGRDQIRELQSPNYPNEDPPGTACRWNIQSRSGTRIFISCPDPKQPQDGQCGARLTVYRKHRPTTFCRTKKFIQHTFSNRMVLTYNTNQTTEAFKCKLHAEEIIQPSWDVCNCGIRNTGRIAWGSSTDISEFPMMVGLYWEPEKDVICGGTIISQHYVLTAAHCLENITKPGGLEESGLFIGDYDRSHATFPKLLAIDRLIIHEEYSIGLDTINNDIALLHVKFPIRFNRKVSPVCLPFSNKNRLFVDEMVNVLGWGRKVDWKYPKFLQIVEVQIVHNVICDYDIRDVSVIPENICSSFGGKGACKGDSGGPVLWEDPETHKQQLIGIVSLSAMDECGRDFNIDTRVTYHLDWIEKNTPGETYCKKGCDRAIRLKRERTAELKSPNYPNDEPPGTTCSWTIDTPPGTTSYLSCQTPKQPEERPCGGGLTVDIQNNPTFHCRTEKFTQRSVANRMIVTLDTQQRSAPGKPFTCMLSVEEPNPCNCGKRNTVNARIWGGSAPGINEYTMMAGLVFLKKHALFCGATIISHNYVLTAASCVQNQDEDNKFGVLVGDHDRSITTDTEHSTVIPVDCVVIHDDFNSETLENDIALVHTVESVHFNQQVGPACLPFNNKDKLFIGENVHVLGWGSTNDDLIEPTSSILRVTKMGVIDNTMCKLMWPGSFGITQFCTFTKSGGACKFDTGGPVLWEDPVTHKLKLAGITSSAKCTATANSQTRVNAYLDWIVANADGADFCKE